MERALVGRDAELAALQATLDAAPPPRPVIAVHGEAGIGKTRLAGEFARAAEKRGATVLWGTCHEDNGRPYTPWVEAIDRYLARLEPERLAELLWTDATVLAPVAPSIEIAIPELPVPVGLSAADAQLRLFDAIARFLDRLRAPVVVLDDLQWADAAALDLFVHLARVLPDLLIVATFRGAKLALDDPLAIHLGSVARVRPCSYLALKGLSLEHGAQLLERTAEKKLDPRVVEAVHSETRGNPFFLSELGRHFRAVNGWGTGLQLPETIRGMVALRLSGLAEGTRQMLEAAAVFTRGFSFGELQILSGTDEVALLDALEEALAAELLVPLGRERYDFAHALVRHTLYDGLNPSRRGRMHRRLAEQLERLAPDPSPAVAAEIARQYYASSALPGSERGVPHALRAAEHARSVQAPADAVELLQAALELVPAVDEFIRAQVLCALAPAEAEAGMPAQAAATLFSATRFLERSGASDRVIAQLTCEIGTAILSASMLPWAALPVIRRAVVLLGDRHDLLWARLKLAYRFGEALDSGPMQILRFVPLDPEAREILRAQGTEADIANTIEVTGPWPAGELEWLIDQVSSWEDPAAKCTALVWLLTRLALVEPGSYAPTDRLCRWLEALAEEIGAASHRTRAAALRSALHGIDGALDEAAEQLALAKTLLQRQPEPEGFVPLIAVLDALIVQHRDRDWWRRGDELLRAAGGPAPPHASALCAALACHAFAQGSMPDRARELLAQMLPGLRSASPWDHMFAPAVAYAAAAVWEMRDEGLAAELLPVAEEIVDAGVPDWYMTSADLTIARLCAVLDHFGRAASAFERARVKLERQGQRPMRAIVDYDEAAARLWRGRDGVLELARSADARFHGLGMTAWQQRAAGLVRAASGEDLPDGLTRRQVEVLRLLAQGRTNRGIADELVLSVHTVERHINNIYFKIGAHNRAEATAYTIQHGL